MREPCILFWLARGVSVPASIWRSKAWKRPCAVYGTPIYVYHEIVHNQWVVERFRGLGAVFVNDLAEVPAGAHLLYSAHGVSPEVRREAARRQSAHHRRHLPAGDQGPPRGGPFRGRRLHDHSHRSCRARRGGGHDGRGPGAFLLVQTPADVDRLEVADPEKLAYLTQTTLSVTMPPARSSGCASDFPRSPRR